MSNKASVTKELNAKHTKILEALLKVPDNKLCADCQRQAKSFPNLSVVGQGCISLGLAAVLAHISGSRDSCLASCRLDSYVADLNKFIACHTDHQRSCFVGVALMNQAPKVSTLLPLAPRWASINLGIFICLQCSGVHRSLGVHISKVRSTTLDTWLPEQIACMQSAGNEKSNSYWEAELPLNFDRQEIEKFIRAKYEEKRWIPKSERETTPTISEINPNFANFEEVESMDRNETETGPKISETVSTSEIPVESGSKTRNIKKTRKLSVEEENHKMEKLGKAGRDTSTKENNGKAPTDLFSLLYINNTKQERSKDRAPKAMREEWNCCGNGQWGVIGPVHEMKYTECTKGWCKERIFSPFYKHIEAVNSYI